MNPTTSLMDEWKRVIDHMKRLFAIICGLAITLACANAYTCLNKSDWIGLLQFVILIVTVIPIFHGAERSLDLKYLRPERPGARPFWVIVDLWSLLITALFFVVIAQSVPDYSKVASPPPEVLRERFLMVLGIAFLFDVVVLLGGAIRSGAQPATESTSPFMTVVRAHIVWMALNGSMAAAALAGPAIFDPREHASLLFGVLTALAILRSILDYGLGWQFLFPPGPGAAGSA